jgi:hypothetical protein
LDRFSDLLVEPLPPLTMTGRGCSLKPRKAFLKNLDLHRLLTDLTFQQGNALGIQSHLRANSFAGKANSPLARHSPSRTSSRLELS